MTKPLTMEKKKEIIDYLKEHTWKETANKFNVSEMTIKRIKQQIDINILTSTNNNTELLIILREMFENGVIKVYKEKLTEKYKNALEML